MKNIKNFDDCDIMEQIDETIDNDYAGMHYAELSDVANPSDGSHWKLTRKKVRARTRDPRYVSEENER